MRKTCTLCSETKLLTQFHRATKSKDGHHSKCKTCANAKDDRQLQEKLDEKVAKSRFWFEAHRGVIR